MLIRFREPFSIVSCERFRPLLIILLDQSAYIFLMCAIGFGLGSLGDPTFFLSVLVLWINRK